MNDFCAVLCLKGKMIYLKILINNIYVKKNLDFLYQFGIFLGGRLRSDISVCSACKMFRVFKSLRHQSDI